MEDAISSPIYVYRKHPLSKNIYESLLILGREMYTVPSQVEPDRPSGMSNMFGNFVRVSLSLSTIAFLSNMIITFYARWTIHTNTLSQYESLALSEICSNPQLRVRSEEVNNCGMADKFTRGGSLPPATLALLETLQRLALCAGELEPTGIVQNRCDAIVESLASASTKITALLVVFMLSLAWMFRQYNALNHIRHTSLPLDTIDYPNHATLPPWLKESK